MRAHVLRNTLISILVALFSITATSCGKTARLERLERERAEIAAEQARADKLCKQKGIWERFSSNTWTYVIGTAAFVAVVVGVGTLIHHRYKKTGIPPGVENLNNQPAEVQQEEVHQVPQPEHFEENAQFPPPFVQEQNHIDNIPAQEAQNQIMQHQAENVLQLQIQQINEHQEVVAQMQHEAPPAENIQEPEIHNDEIIPEDHPAQNPQQNLEVANNAAIPQQDLELTAEEQIWLYIEHRATAQELWLREDRQLRIAQQLPHNQQMRVDAYDALLDAESRVMSSPYAHNSVEHMILVHRWNIVFGQWEATHLANIGYTTPPQSQEDADTNR